MDELVPHLVRLATLDTDEGPVWDVGMDERTRRRLEPRVRRLVAEGPAPHVRGAA